MRYTLNCKRNAFYVIHSTVYLVSLPALDSFTTDRFSNGCTPFSALKPHIVTPTTKNNAGKIHKYFFNIKIPLFLYNPVHLSKNMDYRKGGLRPKKSLKLVPYYYMRTLYLYLSFTS